MTVRVESSVENRQNVHFIGIVFTRRRTLPDSSTSACQNTKTPTDLTQVRPGNQKTSRSNESTRKLPHFGLLTDANDLAGSRMPKTDLSR